MSTTPEIVKQVMERRAAADLHVTLEGPDGHNFNYYPATEAQKSDFLRRAKRAGRVTKQKGNVT